MIKDELQFNTIKNFFILLQHIQKR